MKASRFLLFGLTLAVWGMFLCVGGGSAQSTTDGAIGGTVTEQSCGVVPSAIVTSQNLA
jgi:hypothetical protein